MLERRLELHRADAEAAVSDDDDHLLSRTCELRPDPHADAMPDGRQGSRVDDLAGEARTEALREPSRQREAVDHESGIVVHGGDEVVHEARGMDRHGVVHRARLLGESPIERGADVRGRASPGRIRRAVEAARPGAVQQLGENELRVAGDRDLRRHVPADALRCGVHLDVRGRAVPRGWSAEVLATPELETERQHDVGAARERLLPRAAHGQGMVLRDGALGGTSRVHRDLELRGEGQQLRRGVGPEHPVARDDERARGVRERVECAFDGGGVGGAAQLRGGIEARAGELPRHVALLVEDVRRDLDDRRAGRRAQRGAKARP